MKNALKVKNTYLKDTVIKKLVTQTEVGRQYLNRLLSSLLNIPVEVISINQELVHPEVAINENIRNAEADIVVRISQAIINIEANGIKSKTYDLKNMSYVLNLVLKQIPKGKIMPNDIKKVIQINLNAFDAIDNGKTVSWTMMTNQDTGKIVKKYDIIEFCDINLANIASMSYNEIMEESKDSINKLLYILTAKNENALRKIYDGDDLMCNLVNEAKDLTNDFDAMLYYDPEELWESAKKEQAERIAVEKNKKEIAANLLRFDVDIDIIRESIGLSQEELEELKESM